LGFLQARDETWRRQTCIQRQIPEGLRNHPLDPAALSPMALMTAIPLGLISLAPTDGPDLRSCSSSWPGSPSW